MIIDKSLMIADGLAYNGAPTVINLGKPKMGKGEPITLMVMGSANLAGCTGITITDGATVAAADAHETQVLTLAGQTHRITLRNDVNQYVKVALAGSVTAGTWSCGVVAGAVQTNE